MHLPSVLRTIIHTDVGRTVCSTRSITCAPGDAGWSIPRGPARGEFPPRTMRICFAFGGPRRTNPSAFE